MHDLLSSTPWDLRAAESPVLHPGRPAGRWWVPLMCLCAVILGDLANRPIVFAADDEPKPQPAQRPAMKAALEALKQREPRLPRPPRPTDSTTWTANNGAFRKHYLPEGWTQADFRPDPAYRLADPFKVRIFWLVSRLNNCQYCLGHQEHKLLSAGMTEDEIAALDVNWKRFPAREQLAFELATQMTVAPDRVDAETIEQVLREYSAPEVAEVVYVTSFFNSVNRWTDSLGLPQDEKFRNEPLILTTATSPEYQSTDSALTPRVVATTRRRTLPDDLAAAIASASERTPRIELLEPAAARAALTCDLPEVLPAWMRLMAYFPQVGSQQIAAIQLTRTTGKTSPRVKAIVAWVSARANRSWSMLATASDQLVAAGIAHPTAIDEQGSSAELSPAENAVAKFVHKLTVTPQQIVDRDIARLRDVISDHEVAEVVYLACTANMLDRLHEVLNLPPERVTATR